MDCAIDYRQQSGRTMASGIMAGAKLFSTGEPSPNLKEIRRSRFLLASPSLIDHSSSERANVRLE